MTLQDCYAAFGGNYADVSARLRSEDVYKRQLLKASATKMTSILTQ